MLNKIFKHLIPTCVICVLFIITVNGVTGAYRLYDQLDSEQKSFYDAVVGLTPSSGTVNIPLLTPITFYSATQTPTDSEKSEAFAKINRITQVAIDAAITDNPMLFWLDITNSTASITYSARSQNGQYLWTISSIKYNVAVYGNFASDPDAAINAVNSAVSGFHPAGSTLYEKVKSIHDYICQTVSYSLSAANPYNAYGALIDGQAVCEGYSEAFKLICDYNNIPCVLVSGAGISSSATPEEHMWNLVKMEDGKWYAVDVTWDDQSSGITYKNFLVGSSTPIRSNGNTFSGTHIPNGDISRTGLKTFAYPTLSETEYNVSGETTVSTVTSAPGTTYVPTGTTLKETVKPPEITKTPYTAAETPRTTTKANETDSGSAIKTSDTENISEVMTTEDISGTTIHNDEYGSSDTGFSDSSDTSGIVTENTPAAKETVSSTYIFVRIVQISCIVIAIILLFSLIVFIILRFNKRSR